MKNNIFISIFIVAILFSSCKKEAFSYIYDYPTKNIPFADSTNFSNFIEGKLLTPKQQAQLKLNDIFGEETQNAKIGIAYLPKISKNYTSIVFYNMQNNTELISVLVNYNKKFEIISSQVLAFDEITDNLLKTTAKVTENNIILTEYISDSKSSINFKILDNGTITRE